MKMKNRPPEATALAYIKPESIFDTIALLSFFTIVVAGICHEYGRKKTTDIYPDFGEVAQHFVGESIQSPELPDTSVQYTLNINPDTFSRHQSFFAAICSPIKEKTELHIHSDTGSYVKKQTITVRKNNPVVCLIFTDSSCPPGLYKADLWSQSHKKIVASKNFFILP